MKPTCINIARCFVPALGVITALLLTSPATALAADIEGHLIGDRFVVESLELDLYSAAIKKATFMKVKVYAVGLYTGGSASGPDAIVDSSDTAAFVLTFLRDVGRDKLAECFLSDLRKACGGDCEDLLTQASAIAARLPDITEGDTIAYILRPTGVEVLVNGASIGGLLDDTASAIVLAAFVGEGAPKDLRKALRAPRKDLFASQIEHIDPNE